MPVVFCPELFISVLILSYLLLLLPLLLCQHYSPWNLPMASLTIDASCVLSRALHLCSYPLLPPSPSSSSSSLSTLQPLKFGHGFPHNRCQLCSVQSSSSPYTHIPHPFLLCKVFSINHFSFFGLSALLFCLDDVINLMPNSNPKDQAFIFVCAPLGRLANA